MRSIAPRTRVLAAAILALTALIVAAVVLRPAPVTGFSWARAQGWSIAPVRVVRLEPRWLRRFQPIPPNLSPTDITVLRACWTNPFHPSPYYKNFRSTVVLRNFYQSQVTRFPGQFYPENLLAEWYQDHHDAVNYRLWEQRALHDAPAIIAGKICDDNGKPVSGATYDIQLDTYEPRRFQNSHAIAYSQLVTTDQEGCYYLPVFRGIYTIGMSPGLRQGVIWDAQGKSLNAFSRGPETSDWLHHVPTGQITTGMVATSHVGVLSTIIARPPMEILAPSPFSAVNGEQKSPAKLSGSVLDFRWTAVPGAKQYSIQLSTISPEDGGQVMIWLDEKDYKEEVEVSKPEWRLIVNRAETFDGRAPILNRDTTYELQILAWDSTNTTDVSSIAGMTDGFRFIPANAPPIPLTRGNFARALVPKASCPLSLPSRTQYPYQGVLQRER